MCGYKGEMGRDLSLDFKRLTVLHNRMWLVGTWMASRLFPSAASDSLPVSNIVPWKGPNTKWKHHSSQVHTHTVAAQPQPLRREKWKLGVKKADALWTTKLLIDSLTLICLTFDYKCWQHKFPAPGLSLLTQFCRCHRPEQLLMTCRVRNRTSKNPHSLRRFINSTGAERMKRAPQSAQVGYKRNSRLILV